VASHEIILLVAVLSGDGNRTLAPPYTQKEASYADTR